MSRLSEALILFRTSRPSQGRRRVRGAVDGLLEKIGNKKIDAVVGMSRAAYLAAPIAYKLRVGFVPGAQSQAARDVVSVEYDLEYGSRRSEHKDAIKPGARVLISTTFSPRRHRAGTIELIKQLKGEIVACFLIELSALKGRDKLAGMRRDPDQVLAVESRIPAPRRPLVPRAEAPLEDRCPRHRRSRDQDRRSRVRRRGARVPRARSPDGGVRPRGHRPAGDRRGAVVDRAP